MVLQTGYYVTDPLHPSSRFHGLSHQFPDRSETAPMHDGDTVDA